MRVLSFICAFAVLFSATMAAACSCGPPPPPQEALSESGAVFAGKVKKVKKVAKIELGERLYQYEVTLSVSTTWKGTKGKTITVQTSTHGASCGYNFEVGKEYLVYSDKRRKSTKPPSPHSVSLCSRTKPLADAKGDLKELGEGTKVE